MFHKKILLLSGYNEVHGFHNLSIKCYFSIICDGYLMRDITRFLRIRQFNSSGQSHSTSVKSVSRESRDEVPRKALILSDSEFYNVGIFADRPCKPESDPFLLCLSQSQTVYLAILHQENLLNRPPL